MRAVTLAEAVAENRYFLDQNVSVLEDVKGIPVTFGADHHGFVFVTVMEETFPIDLPPIDKPMYIAIARALTKHVGMLKGYTLYGTWTGTEFLLWGEERNGLFRSTMSDLDHWWVAGFNTLPIIQTGRVTSDHINKMAKRKAGVLVIPSQSLTNHDVIVRHHYHRA